MTFFMNSAKKADPKINKVFNSFCTEKCLKEAVDGRLKCSCGEDTPIFDWIWQDQQSNNVRIFDGGREILFHPVYSCGTAAVRGQFPFQQNYHYYWEVKIISKLYGTDVMVGVGTSKIIFEDWQFRFGSLLGIDSESWGFSYHGNIQHNKLKGKYGIPFGLGSIVGVHLDMCNGTLEYFLNRKSLGIAFRDLKGKELYPMVCSTAAKSSVRIICCMSKKPTLQMMSLKRIMDHPGLYRKYKNIPGLARIYDKQLFWIQPQVPRDEKKRMAELDEDVALSLVDRSYLVKNKKFRASRLISFLYGDELEKIENDSSFEVYDICVFDLSAIRKPHMDESDRPSTSDSGARSSNRAKEDETVSLCLLCLSTTHESKNCTLRRNSDDSDSDNNETTELSEIL